MRYRIIYISDQRCDLKGLKSGKCYIVVVFVRTVDERPQMSVAPQRERVMCL